MLEVEDRGDHIELRLAGGGFPETSLEDLIGCTGYKGPVYSVEEMNAARRVILRGCEFFGETDESVKFDIENKGVTGAKTGRDQKIHRL